MNENKKYVKIVGESYYSTPKKMNKKGRYGVGISNPIMYFDKNISEKDRKIFTENFKKMVKTNDNGVETIQITNSKYPLEVVDFHGAILDSVKMMNGLMISVVCSIRFNEEHKRFYLVVESVKLLEEVKHLDVHNDIVFN